ncbi:MAG: alpha/beta hydrolase [Chloroflexota bacterium]|nr:alpha/beta hydrolase [Chloroflexota bacterium]
MAVWDSGYVEANGLRIHYYRTGGAKPQVVLAHGVTDDGLCWTPVAEVLAPEYDVVMVDARGHGRSDAPEGGYGPAEQAEDLAGVIAALGLERPAILGHSMGAATALTLAGAHPEMPRAILLEDPPAWWVETRERRANDGERRAGMRSWLAGRKRKTREELIAEQRAQTPNWSEAEIAPWADAKHRVSMAVLDVFGPDNPASVDWAATLRRVRCPVLLITGDPAHGAIVTEGDAAALEELIPHLRVAHIPGTGHSIRRDHFAQYLEVVRGFLAETHTAA